MTLGEKKNIITVIGELQEKWATGNPSSGCNPWDAVSQGISTAALYMAGAQTKIDAHFGAGYALAHPELIGHFMQTACADANGFVLARAMQELRVVLDRLADEVMGGLDSAGDLCIELDDIGGTLKKIAAAVGHDCE